MTQAAPLGCLLHPVTPPSAQLLAESQSLPGCAHDHVHVFLVNGVDPAHLCNLRGLGEFIQELGYHNVHFCQMWDCGRFEKEIRQIRSEDPQARIAVIGFSGGVLKARSLAHALNTDGTPIDLLVYLASDLLGNCPTNRPENAHRVINFRAWGYVFLACGFINGADIDGCENHSLGMVRHACVPTHPEVLEVVAHALAALAASTTAPLPGPVVRPK